MNAFGSNRLSHRSPLSVAIFAALALCAAGTSFAAEGPADQPADATPAVATTGATADDAAALDMAPKDMGPVIVTANKRPEDIRNVASSISVVSDEQLENIAASSLIDYGNYVPGLQVASDGTPGQTRVSLRGIAPLSSGATVGTYIDETPVGSSGIYQVATIFMLDLLPYDIERVEILRGPQGTLYGAGSMGGLLKYVTRQPDLSETEFRIGAGFATVDEGDNVGNYRFSANLPLSKDRLGLRVSYAKNDIPGYIDNSITNEEDINDGDQTSARAALLWQGDDTSLKLTAMRQTIDSDNNAAVSLSPTTQKPLKGDLTHMVFVDSPFSKDIDYYAATFDWSLDWAEFTSATGYSETVTERRQDTTVDYGSFTQVLGLPTRGSSYFDTRLDLDQFTQEFRLASKAGTKLEWLVGTFYSKEDGTNRQELRLAQMDGSPLPPPFTPAGDLATLQLPTTFEEVAVFANAAYSFTDRFKLGAGVRYAENDQDFVQIVESGLLLPVGETPNTSSENVFTWSLTPQFQLSKDNLLYGRVATGYQPGGPNVALPGVPQQVDSSTLTNYELGWKSTLADNRLQFDVAVFRIDWEDIQVSAFFNGNSGLINGGEAKSEGVEFSSMFRPNANVQLGLNVAYTDAELSEDFPTITVPSGPFLVNLNSGLSGDRMPFTPEWQASFTADFYFDLGTGGWEGNVGGGYRWADDRVTGTTQRQVVTTAAPPPTVVQTTITPPFELDSYEAIDLYAGVSNDHWSIRAYIKNAFDERAYTNLNDHQNQVTGVVEELVATPIQPRTFGIEVDYRF